MQVSWSPIASWIRSAATAESTPPDSPQMTRPFPTCALILAISVGAELRHGPIAGTARDATHEVGDERGAVRRMHHLGMELDAIETARIVGDGRERRAVRHGDGAEARR